MLLLTHTITKLYPIHSPDQPCGQSGTPKDWLWTAITFAGASHTTHLLTLQETAIRESLCSQHFNRNIESISPLNKDKNNIILNQDKAINPFNT
jgi:hypothetical protein